MTASSDPQPAAVTTFTPAPASAQTTSVPPPIFMPQSSPAPTPHTRISAIPTRPAPDHHDPPQNKSTTIDLSSSSHTTNRHNPQPPDLPYPKPTLRLLIHDLTSPGTVLLLASINPSEALRNAVASVLTHLYALPPTSLSIPSTTAIPPTRSITLILRSFSGVAYTTSSDLDDDHKEIHLSTDYVAGLQGAKSSIKHEIQGVVTHEVVHCYQWTGEGTVNGGVVEGVADWVRMRSGVGAGHWQRKWGDGNGGGWDAGYETTGWFLDWMGEAYGGLRGKGGVVERINQALRHGKYQEDVFWKVVVGEEVDVMWHKYGTWLSGRKGETREEIE